MPAPDNAQHAVNSPRRDEIVCFMLNPHATVRSGDPPESPLISWSSRR